MRKNLLSVVDQTMVSGANFLATVVVGRFSGIEALGAYSLAFTVLVSLTAVGESLVTLPYTVYGNRVHGEERSRYAGSILVHFALLTAAATLLLFVAAGAIGLGWGSRATGRTVLVLALVAPFFSLREFSRRMSFAHLHVLSALLIDVVATSVFVGVLAWLWWTGSLSVDATLAALGVSCGVAGGLWLAVHRQAFLVSLRGARAELGRSWRLGRWACAARLTSVAHNYAQHWLLSILWGVRATGAFAACSTILAASNPLLMGIGNVLAPDAARCLARGGAAELRRMVYTTTAFITGATLVFSTVIVLCGRYVLQFLYGVEYGDHYAMLAILAVALPLGIAGMAADNGLRALERTDVNFKASGLGLITSVCVTLALAEELGVVAGAIAVLVGSAVTAGGRFYAFVRLVNAR